MISNYFNEIVKRLTIQDFNLLYYLGSESANMPLRAKNRQEILLATNFSEAIYRKVVNRLESIYFIDSVGEGKAYAYYLTEYGTHAFEKMSQELEQTKIN